MKAIILFLTVLTIFGCNSNKLSGRYVCDASQKKETNTVRKGDTDVVSVDFTCIIDEIEFKGEKTIVLKVAKGGEVMHDYVLEDGYAKIKSDQGIVAFKIVDSKTLEGQLPFRGTYHKR